MKALFAVGDFVKPKPEWIGDPNNVPTGIVREVVPWGDVGAIYVEGERHAFAAYVFDKVDLPTDEQGSAST